MNKKGSYIVEAAVTLPVLIIAVCSLILIIRIVMVCEGICFSTSEYLIDVVREPFEKTLSVSLCKKIEKKVLADETQLTDFQVTKADYLHEDSLIAIEAEANFSVVNPIGINGQIRFVETIVTRPMIGDEQGGEPLDERRFCDGSASNKVVIFPKYGERYHKESCVYVRQANEENICILEIEKEDARLKEYTPCLVCGGAAVD